MQLSLILQSLCEIRTRMISIFLEKKQKLRGIHKLPQVTQLINGGADIWICRVELESPKSFSVPQICPSVSGLRTFVLPFTSACVTLPPIHSLQFSSFKWKGHFLREAPCPQPLTGSLCGSPRFSEPLPTLCTEATLSMDSTTSWVSPGLLTPQAFSWGSSGLLIPQVFSAFPREGRGWEGASRRVSLLSFSWMTYHVSPNGPSSEPLAIFFPRLLPAWVTSPGICFPSFFFCSSSSFSCGLSLHLPKKPSQISFNSKDRGTGRLQSIGWQKNQTRLSD